MMKFNVGEGGDGGLRSCHEHAFLSVKLFNKGILLFFES
jgi:hypothetical protein